MNVRPVIPGKRATRLQVGVNEHISPATQLITPGVPSGQEHLFFLSFSPIPLWIPLLMGAIKTLLTIKMRKESVFKIILMDQFQMQQNSLHRTSVPSGKEHFFCAHILLLNQRMVKGNL